MLQKNEEFVINAKGGSPFMGFLMMLVSSLLIGHWSWYNYIVWDVAKHDLIFYLFLGISGTLVFLQQWSYVAVRCTDPGTDARCTSIVGSPENVKDQSRIIVRDEQILYELINSNDKDPKINQQSHLPSPPITKEKLKDQLMQLRAYKCTHIVYCVDCESFRDPRSHHCRNLGVCVRRFDHYCHYIDNCIGMRNIRYFLQYLFWTFLTLGWMIFDQLYLDIIIRKHNIDRLRITILYSCLGVGGFQLLFVFIIWIVHCSRSCRNITSIESLNDRVTDSRLKSGSNCSDGMGQVCDRTCCIGICCPFPKFSCFDNSD